jgi:hypothetical protein
MMTTTDRAAAIRATLKAKGISSRKVSVRADYYSMGSSIDVRIKDPDVSLPLVKAIATPHESIDRCAYSGEILSGGNRYVHVSYTREAEEVLASRWLAPVTTALADVKENFLIPVAGTPYLVGTGPYGNRFALWGDNGHIGEYGSAAGIASAIGARMVAAATA